MPKLFYPNRLKFDVETDKDGETTLKFKEWHDFVTAEEFKIIAQNTEAIVELLMKRHAHLKLNIEFTPNLAEKSFEAVYRGKDVSPAISAIYWELMPLLLKNTEKAFDIIDLLMQAIKFWMPHVFMES